MRSHFRKVVTNILFNQKKVGERGEVSWTESMLPVTHFAWRFANCVFLPRVPVERGSVMLKTGGVTWRLQDACFKGAFTELWKPQRILYRAVEAINTVFSVITVVCQGPLPLPSTLPKFPRTGFFLPLRDTSQSPPSPHLGYFLPPPISLMPVAQPPPSSPPFLLAPLTTTSTPLPTCQGLCNTLVPPGPWATSSPFQGQELQSSGKFHSVWLDPDTEKTTPQETKSFLSTNPKEIFGACWNSTSDKSI